MYVIVAKSPKGPKLARSSRCFVQDAVKIAAAMKDTGHTNVMITDLREGKPKPLAWWLDALAEECA